MMKVYGRSTVHEFVGDFIVYRNLVPVDPRLPSLAEIAPGAGLAPGTIPRKSAPEYARVIVHLLRAARSLDSPATAIERLVYVGDTRLNDGTAFSNVCQAGDWPGLAFIAAENPEPPRVEIADQAAGRLYLANRWTTLADFDRYCHEHGFPVDEHAAVIVDLDKTALGARGRNDHVIDAARVEAVQRTVGGLLGDSFDPAAFQRAYDLLNQPAFHPFTSDNQDYLAYVCLVLGSGLYSLDELVRELRGGRLADFYEFIARVDGRAGELPTDLGQIHAGIYDRVQQGDPTPFKTFRYNEYLVTVERLGRLDDDAPVEDLLGQEIVITSEVREVALRWQSQGALLFALSDKPDEASIPSQEQAARGYRPIHQTETHAVGEE